MTHPHPYAVTGRVIELEGRRVIELDPCDSVIDSGFDRMPVGTPVRVIYWTASPDGSLTELETIADRQQLGLDIVAHGLESEGALSDDRLAFLNRLLN